MGAFGIRRPLRMLSHKLELDESQVAVLAEFLDDLRTEEAQAQVDKRRSQKLLATAMASEPFDQDAVRKAAALRTESRARVQQLTAQGLERFHAVLEPAQRKRFATMMLAGPLVF